MQEHQHEEDGLKITGRTVHDRNLLRVEAGVINTGDAPLEGLVLRIGVDTAEFHVRADQKVQVHHLLPGDRHDHVFELEPRHTVEEALLRLRGRANRGEDELRFDVDLGSVAFKVKGTRKQGDGEGIPRM